MSKTKHPHLTFIRYGRINEIDRMLVVKLEFREPVTQEEALEAYKDWVTEVCEKTPSGKAALDYAGDDLNIGDALSMISDEEALPFMENHGICGASVIYDMTVGEEVCYDHVLFKGELPDE